MVFQTAVVGTRGVKFPMFRPVNAVDRITGLRPNPNLGQPNYVDNSQTVTYYGWQNSLRKRFSRSFSFDVNYTWSKALSNGGGDTGAYYDGENSSRNQEFFDLKADRGPTASDITHYFSADWVYQLPALAGRNAFLRHVAGDWQLAGILSAQTGLPIIVTQSSSTSSQRGDYIGGPALLPDYQRRCAISIPRRSSASRFPARRALPIRPGNFSPGALRAPGLWNLNFSLAKNFTLVEKVKLQIRTRHVQRVQSYEPLRVANEPERPAVRPASEHPGSPRDAVECAHHFLGSEWKRVLPDGAKARHSTSWLAEAKAKWDAKGSVDRARLPEAVIYVIVAAASGRPFKSIE